MVREDPCPWDWKTALREACKQAQRDGYRYRVIAYSAPSSPTGWAWTYRPLAVKALRSVYVPGRWRI